jgi:hypothetical protein
MQAQPLSPLARRLDRLSRHIGPAPCASLAPNALFTSAEMQQYEELGYVVVKGLLSDSEVHRFCERFKRRAKCFFFVALFCPLSISLLTQFLAVSAKVVLKIDPQT